MKVWGFELHWDWNPVLFFILLAVTLVLAAKMLKKWQVAWVLPALVLYAGLDWALPMSWLFKLVFWLVLLFALATALLPGKSRLAKVPVGMMAALLALTVLLSGVNYTGNWFDNWLNGDGAAPSATPTPTTSPSATDEEFTILLPRRDGNRLNADGVPKEMRGDGEAFRKFIAEQAKHDPLTLFHYYMASPLGDTAPLKNELILAKDGVIKDGNTYSEKGIAAYNRWAALWNNPDITSVEAVKEITFQAVNTGVAKGKPTQDSSGVGGKDKSGYDVAYHDATGKVVKEHSALNRCTQPTKDKPTPGVPPGPTDNPPTDSCPNVPGNQPPGTDCTPPEECVEIPGNGKLECQPKEPGKEPGQQNNVPGQSTGENPGAGNQPASGPSATPSPTYTAPATPAPEPTRNPTTVPTPEPSTPPSSSPEPSPTQDPCKVNPDWC